MNTRPRETWPIHRRMYFDTYTVPYALWNEQNALISEGSSVGILEEGLAERGRFSSCASSVQVEDAFLTNARPGVYMIIQVDKDEPQWLRPTVERMESLLGLQPNWDSYNACGLKTLAIETALGILERVMGPSTPPPTVVPTVEGGIQLEWHQNNIDLEVEVNPEGQVLMSRQGGFLPEVSEVDVNREFQGLVDAIGSL